MIKKINGSWLEFHHNGLPEGKYFNEDVHNFTNQQWKEKVKEMATLKMKYIVVMEVAYTDLTTPTETFYDSKYYPKSKRLKASDPIEAVLAQADEEKMRVFLSIGFFMPWQTPNENMADLEKIKESFKGIKEIHEKYGHHKSLYGWYFPDESEINKYLDEHTISCVNMLSEYIYSLNNKYKTLIAPYGTCKLVADEFYTNQLKRLNVDFVAYQDEVGVRKTDESKTQEFYKNLKKAHDTANKSKLWADVEIFEFEGNVYQSALLPANIKRIKAQLEAVSDYVDEILVFQYEGIMNPFDSKAYCGAEGSIALYNDYKMLLDKIEKEN